MGGGDMKLAWVTDPHLDFAKPQVAESFYAKLAATAPDAIVVTGDISNGRPELFLRQVHDHVQVPVHFVLGNHDFYNHGIDQVRERIDQLCSVSGYKGDLFYLPRCAPLALSSEVALVGVDGWADGGYGNWESSTVWLTDYNLIRDLSRVAHTRPMLRMQLQTLAQAEARLVAQQITLARERGFTTVIVATHVPPFHEATWHQGQHSDDNWAPHFASRAMGDALVLAQAATDMRVLVLCGHTHGVGCCHITPNLAAWTGAATYGFPQVQTVLEIKGAQVSTPNPVFRF